MSPVEVFDPSFRLAMIKSVKGTRDLLPPESFFWGRVEEIARAVFGAYGFDEIRTPILEETQLFVRGIGEGTDIVHKEMYTFLDKKGRSLTMRPEMTASVARAFVEHGLAQQPMPLRFWYTGPMFRYERPQKGRYRQFHQVGAEIFGASSPETDADLILSIFTFLERLRFRGLTLRLNSVGDAACRPAYLEALRAAARAETERLCPDCVRRAESNPLRLFDCKVPSCGELAKALPLPSSFLCDPCRDHSTRLDELLAGLDVTVKSDPRLVRGLDYYTRTVFEVSAAGLGSQDAILGGGRYDRLVADLGGPDVPAVGFAAGLDRILEIIPERFRKEETDDLDSRVLVIPIGRTVSLYALRVAEVVRDVGLSAEVELLGRSPKAALGLASKRGFQYAILVGEKESDAKTVVLRSLETKEQEELPLADLGPKLEEEGTKRLAERFLEEAADDDEEEPEDLDGSWEEPDQEDKWH